MSVKLFHTEHNLRLKFLLSTKGKNLKKIISIRLTEADDCMVMCEINILLFYFHENPSTVGFDCCGSSTLVCHL